MTGFERLIKDGTEHQSPTLKTFTPRGYRTRPLNYERGMSGKQSAMRFPENPTKPIILLVMDSNGRNIVKPQKVNPSPHTSFDLAAISIPGGKTFHACTELRHLSKCDHKVSHVVLSLGTNDMSEGPQVLTRFSSRVENLIRVAQDVYPDANISYVSVLPRHDEFSEVVPEANKLILQIMQYFQLPFISITVPDDPWNWSDLIHLSDAGLKLFMQNFETEVETKLFGNPNSKPAKVTPKFKRFSSSYSVPSYESRRSGLKRHSSCATSLSFNAKRPSLEKESKDLRLDCNETWPSLGTSNRFDVLSENTKETFTDETSINTSEDKTPTSKATSCRTTSPWSKPASQKSRKITACKNPYEKTREFSNTASSQDSNSQSSKFAPRQKPSPWAPTSARRLSNSMESKLQSFKLEKSRLKRQNLDSIVPSSSSCATTSSCDLSKSVQARSAFPKPMNDSSGQDTFDDVNNKSRGATKNRLVPWAPGITHDPPMKIKFKISSTKQPVGRPRKIDPGFIPRILSFVTDTKRPPTAIQNDLTESSHGDVPKETPVGLVRPITQKPPVTRMKTSHKSEGRSPEPQTHVTQLTPVPNTFEPQVPASEPRSISVVISPSRQRLKVTRRTTKKETCRRNVPLFGSDDTNVSGPNNTGLLVHPIGVISPIAKHPAPHINRNFKAAGDTTEIGGNLHQIEIISPIRPAPHVVSKSTDCGLISPIPRRLFDSTMTGSFETTFSDEFRGQRSSFMVHNTRNTMSGFGATVPHNKNRVYPDEQDPRNAPSAGGQSSHFTDPQISQPLAFARPQFPNSVGHSSCSMTHDSNNDVFYFNSAPQNFNSDFTPNQDSRNVMSSQGQRSCVPSYETNEPSDFCAPPSSNVSFSLNPPRIVLPKIAPKDFRNVILQNPWGQGSNDPRNISVPGILGHNYTNFQGVLPQSNMSHVSRKVVNQTPWGQRSCGVNVTSQCSWGQVSNKDGGNALNVQLQAPTQFWGLFPSAGVPENSREVIDERSLGQRPYSPSRIVESREYVGQYSTQHQPAYLDGNSATMFGMAQAPSTHGQGANFTTINNVVTSRGTLQYPVSMDCNAVIETVHDPDDVMVTSPPSRWGHSRGSSFEWGQRLNSQLNDTITDDDMSLFRETTIQSERSFESIGSNPTPGKKKRQSLKLYQPPQTRTPESPSKSKKRKSLEFSRPSKPRTPDCPNKYKNRPLVEINATHRAYCGIFTPKSHHTKLCNVSGTARHPGLFAGPADFVVSTKGTPPIDRLAQTF